jgi:hypothetical protein
VTDDARTVVTGTALDAAVVTARLRELSRLADLRVDRRLDVKVDLSPAAVSRRLRRQSALRALCLRLGAGASGYPGSASPS